MRYHNPNLLRHPQDPERDPDYNFDEDFERYERELEDMEDFKRENRED